MDDESPKITKEGMEFPISLDPEQRFPVPMFSYYSGSPTLPITLRWTDGRGPQEKRLLLASPSV